jgi:2-dehydro-3-deoxygluconokinase
MIARYLAAGARDVISKNGANPVRLSTGGATVIVPVEEVSAIKDTTGTGDSFNGAYLAARLNGSRPEDAARAVIAMAPAVVRHQGALIPR